MINNIKYPTDLKPYFIDKNGVEYDEYDIRFIQVHINHERVSYRDVNKLQIRDRNKNLVIFEIDGRLRKEVHGLSCADNLAILLFARTR